MDTEPGTPRRIPSKDLTAEERKMPGCLHDGGCPNADKASQDRTMRGRETERRFAEHVHGKELRLIHKMDCYLHSSQQHDFLGALPGVVRMAQAFFRRVDFAGLRSSYSWARVYMASSKG